MPFPRFLAKAGLCLGLLSGGVLAGPVPAGKPSHYPAWWFERDVIARVPAAATKPDPVWPADYPVADDFAAVNIGQLKTLVSLAAQDLDVRLPGGAGSAINQLVSSWLAAPVGGVVRDDYAALNQGQLKAVAKLFYDRLAAVPYQDAPLSAGATYPWTSGAGDDDAYAMVNLGQLKRVFSFQLPAVLTFADSDGDGLPDVWELAYWPNLGVAHFAGDPDGDGLGNRAEYLSGTSPVAGDPAVDAATLAFTVYTP